MEAQENLSDRLLIRIARQVRDALAARRPRRCRQVRQQLDDLGQSQEQLLILRRRLALCLDRELPAAAGAVLEEVPALLREVTAMVGAVEQGLEEVEAVVPPLRDVVEDLRAARGEFALRYYPDTAILAAVTETIELEDVYLGDFEIQIHLRQLGRLRVGECLRVVALDPHPAAGHEGTTHPHVRDEHLCAGDATSALAAALAGGRLLDVFQLVNAVLTTYNPHSPFVSLANWTGLACHECARGVNDDDRYYCEGCDEDYCGDCVSYCRSCENSRCLDCLTDCVVCGESTCSGCLTVCPDCGQGRCSGCTEDSSCPCQPKEEEEDVNDGDENQAPGADGSPADNNEGRPVAVPAGTAVNGEADQAAGERHRTEAA